MNVISHEPAAPTKTQTNNARHIVDVALESDSFFVMASRLVGNRVETQWQTARFPTRDLPRAVADLVTTLIEEHGELSLDDFMAALQNGDDDR